MVEFGEINEIAWQLLFPSLLAACITIILFHLMRGVIHSEQENFQKFQRRMGGVRRGMRNEKIVLGGVFFLFFQVTVRYWARYVINPGGYLVKHYDELNFFLNVLRILDGQSFFISESELFLNKDGYVFHILFALLAWMTLEFVPSLTLKGLFDMYATFLYPLLFFPVAYWSFRYLLEKDGQALILLYLFGFFDYFLFNSIEVRPENFAYLFLYPTLVFLIKRLHQRSIGRKSVIILFLLSIIIFLVHFLTFFFLWLFVMTTTFFLLLRISESDVGKFDRNVINNMIILEGILTVLLIMGLFLYANLYIFVSVRIPFFVPVMFKLASVLGISLYFTWMAMWGIFFIVFCVVVFGVQYLVIRRATLVNQILENIIFSLKNVTSSLCDSKGKIVVTSLILTVLLALLALVPLASELTFYRNPWGFIYINSWKFVLAWFIIYALLFQVTKKEHFIEEIENLSLILTLMTVALVFPLSIIVYNIILRFLSIFLPFILVFVTLYVHHFRETFVSSGKEWFRELLNLKLLIMSFLIFWGMSASLMNAARVPYLFLR